MYAKTFGEAFDVPMKTEVQQDAVASSPKAESKEIGAPGSEKVH
jgi:hypothetical protein